MNCQGSVAWQLSAVMPLVLCSRGSLDYYEIATELNRRKQCGVEMRRRHQAIWRTVLPFTLPTFWPPLTRPFVAVVVSFFIRLPLSHLPTRRPRYITVRYQCLRSRRDNRVCVCSLRVELLRPEQTLCPGGLHNAWSGDQYDNTMTTSVCLKLVSKRVKKPVSFGIAINSIKML